MHYSLSLMRTRRFLPLFVTQFLGALNDNLFKNALIILITFRMASSGIPHQEAQQVTVLAAGLFILPFFILSALAGQIADKYEKSRLMRIIKLAEILLMCLGVVGFLMQQTWMLMLVLFGMGTHSTFFGPLKYGVLPDHLHKDELIAGNGLIEAGTFLAILLGTMLGGLLILQPMGESIISLGILAVALLGYGVSRFIPVAPAPAPDLILRWNLFQQTWQIVRHAKAQRIVFISILGISWFWFVGASFLAQIPAYVRYHIGGDEQVITLILSVFSLGIALGSVCCNRLMKGEVHARFVAAGCFGMGLGTLLLVACSPALRAVSDHELMDVVHWLQQPLAWGILSSLLLIAFSGGIFTVPLYALIQQRALPLERSRMVAANNIINSLCMVLSALICIILIKNNFTVVNIFFFMGIASFPVAWALGRSLLNSELTVKL